jgi:hypothetical protein
MAYLEQLRHVAGWLAKGDLWPDWEQESYPELRDLALIPVFAVLFPTARFFLDKFVFEVCIPSPGWLCLFFFSPIPKWIGNPPTEGALLISLMMLPPSLLPPMAMNS